MSYEIQLGEIHLVRSPRDGIPAATRSRPGCGGVMPCRLDASGPVPSGDPVRAWNLHSLPVNGGRTVFVSTITESMVGQCQAEAREHGATEEIPQVGDYLIIMEVLT